MQVLKCGKEDRDVKRDWQVGAFVQDQGRLSELQDGMRGLLAEGTVDTKARTQETANQFGKL